MKPRLIGIDMNGWHDWAVRNFNLDRDGLEQISETGVIVDGGLLSRTVWVGDDRAIVGGPRAQLAVHGRGGGWGTIGAEDRRALIRRSGDPSAWGACLQELGRGARIAFLSIPDLPDFGEDAQEERLAAMRAMRADRPMLVWSSVALALDQCELGSLAGGERLGIIEIEAGGLRVQKLDIIERDGLLAPRRRHFGRLLSTRSGLAARETDCLMEMSAHAGDKRFERVLRLADLPARLAMTAPGEVRSELFRLESGAWVETEGVAPTLRVSEDVAGVFEDIDRAVVHGPCDPQLLDHLRRSISRQTTVEIDIADPEAAARGAFIAAQRVSHGFAPWFDFLPNVATIVQNRTGAAPLSLVGEGEEAPAGKIWRSSKPIPLLWHGGSEDMSIWLKKEDDPQPRVSPAHVQTAPDQNKTVLLYLEQQPAQGRAKLRITSDEWNLLKDRPAVVDWDAGEHDPEGRDWDAIIASFNVRPPVIPDRVVLPAHRDLWYANGGDGLASALARFNGTNFTPVYNALKSRQQLHRHEPRHPERYRSFYAVDSDGKRPTGVDDRDWERLLDVVHAAESVFTQGKQSNNHALGVLSWTFRLCPQSVWPIVADALMGRRVAPRFRGWDIMYPQALGRIAQGDDAFIAAINYLRALPLPWNRNQQACAAFLLSRNDGVFSVLERGVVDLLMCAAEEALCTSLKENFRSQHDYYVPILVAGLLRWRMREPDAFTPGSDPKVERISALIAETLGRKTVWWRKREAYQNVYSAIHDKGTRPDLLQSLFDLL